MALLGASQSTQKELVTSVLALANKLELVRAKTDTLQKIIHDNGSAFETQLTTSAKKVSEVQEALCKEPKPTKDSMVVMFREWFDR